MARDIVNKLPKSLDKKRADPKTFESTPEG